MSSERQYTNLYLQNHETIDKNSSRILNDRREEAFEAFVKAGFPNKKVERYKYSDMGEWFAPDYGVNINRIRFPFNPYEAFKCDVPDISRLLYFVVNDSFMDNPLRKGTDADNQLPEGVIVNSLRKMSEEYPELIENYYGTLAKVREDSIVALNTMFAQDGLVIYIPKNIHVAQPIQIINLLRSNSDMMVNRRVLIIAEGNSTAKILFCDHTIDNVYFMATQVVEVFAAANAHLQIYELEESNSYTTRVSNTFIHQDKDSSVFHNSLTLESGKTRNAIHVLLDQPGADVRLNGAVIEDKKQIVDTNTFIEHVAEHCTSNELYKYVLDDQAIGAFAGTVWVRHGAQHTFSDEKNNNICATKEARMYTQPQLVIYADDVKCSHGSTVGQLNEDAMFYMEQRGIPREEARILLMFAFINQVIDMIELPTLKERLHELVEKRFRGELAKCRSCAICK